MKKFLVLVPIFIIAIIIIIYKSDNKNNNTTQNDIKIEKPIKKISNNKNNKIKIDLKGQVVNPNVYEVLDNARIIDVINLAGGLLDDADTSSINLSKKLKDEDVIIVYKKDNNIEVNTKEEYANIIDNCNKDNQDGCIELTDSKEDNSIVNINTATLEQLMTLSGIGKSKAQKIIDYRNKNGLFNNIEEIMNVAGIGDSIFDKIKDNITV